MEVWNKKHIQLRWKASVQWPDPPTVYSHQSTPPESLQDTRKRPMRSLLTLLPGLLLFFSTAWCNAPVKLNTTFATNIILTAIPTLDTKHKSSYSSVLVTLPIHCPVELLRCMHNKHVARMQMRRHDHISEYFLCPKSVFSKLFIETQLCFMCYLLSSSGQDCTLVNSFYAAL